MGPIERTEDIAVDRSERTEIDTDQQSAQALRPIVHIGYHKTATTWFQKQFYPAVSNYRFVSRERVQAALLKDGAFDFDPERARAALHIDDEMPPILCEESLSGYLHNGGLHGYLSKEMAFRLKAVLPNAQIVMFVRSQPDMVAACYQQYVRGGGTFSARRYLFPRHYLHGAARDQYKIPRFSFSHFDYFHLVEHYGSVFGRENVLVFPYEALRADRDAFIQSFSARLNLQINFEDVRKRAENPSFPMSLLLLGRLLNRFTYRTVADKAYFLHVPYLYTARGWCLEMMNRSGLFGHPPSPARLVGKSTLAWIQQRFWEGNRKLAEYTGIDLRALNYPMDPPAQAVVEPSPPKWVKSMRE